MPKQTVNPASLFSSVGHGFSQAVVASGTKFIFVSGQTAWDANKKIVGTTLAEQAPQAFRNVGLAIEAAGGTISDVVSLRIYIVESARLNMGAAGEALRLAFPGEPPTSTWIGVSFLANPEFLIEIEATAVCT
jgi:2-iminobutanoate/2-iminopropanoate deaminase